MVGGRFIFALALGLAASGGALAQSASFTFAYQTAGSSAVSIAEDTLPESSTTT